MRSTKDRSPDAAALLAVLAAVAVLALASCRTIAAVEALPDDFFANVYTLVVAVVQDVVSIVSWIVAL